MPAPRLIARRCDDTSTAIMEDALVRLDAARARLASRRLPWTLVPTRRSISPESRLGSIALGRTQRAVLDVFVAGRMDDRHLSLTVAVPLDSLVLRVQHRQTIEPRPIPDLGGRTIDAVHAVLDHGERALLAALDPDAEDRFAVIPAMIADTTVTAIDMPTAWMRSKAVCSCGSDHHGAVPELPEAYRVTVERHDPFNVYEIRTEAVRIPITRGDAVARLRDLATLERLRIKDET